ncbi:hypothetical protein HNR60_002835 [Rhodopseudomonas rhenobacensis]|uniref:Uncharacterized protein n=1 Tax=Rhodopseudomonas rhenobacensis TaxID=87461 RepID=A0A7W7Z4Z6_9BRAD|nr:hypothetical protein [Rhodopseudomonas rhenobacensis]MBB5048074.1 hypothetical protein [Rhodopseudomonas rhenobacensis]
MDSERFSAHRPNLLGHRFGAIEMEIIDHDATSVGGRKMQAGLSPDALTAACDERDPPLEIENVRHIAFRLRCCIPGTIRPGRRGFLRAGGDVLTTLPRRPERFAMRFVIAVLTLKY